MSLRERLDKLKNLNHFKSFLAINNNFQDDGIVVGISETNPSAHLVTGFCWGNEHKHKKMAMGIMFHGTYCNNIDSICQNGMHDASHFTNDFYYAVRRSQGKEANPDKPKEIKVLAMAVIVEEEDRLGFKDTKLRNPNRKYSLPLYVITVRDLHCK